MMAVCDAERRTRRRVRRKHDGAQREYEARRRIRSGKYAFGECTCTRGLRGGRGAGRSANAFRMGYGAQLIEYTFPKLRVIGSGNQFAHGCRAWAVAERLQKGLPTRGSYTRRWYGKEPSVCRRAIECNVSTCPMRRLLLVDEKFTNEMINSALRKMTSFRDKNSACGLYVSMTFNSFGKERTKKRSVTRSTLCMNR